MSCRYCAHLYPPFGHLETSWWYWRKQNPRPNTCERLLWGQIWFYPLCLQPQKQQSSDSPPEPPLLHAAPSLPHWMLMIDPCTVFCFQYPEGIKRALEHRWQTHTSAFAKQLLFCHGFFVFWKRYKQINERQKWMIEIKSYCTCSSLVSSFSPSSPEKFKADEHVTG